MMPSRLQLFLAYVWGNSAKIAEAGEAAKYP